MSADPQTMTDVLAALDDRDGGAAGWLQANGLTDAATRCAQGRSPLTPLSVVTAADGESQRLMARW